MKTAPCLRPSLIPAEKDDVDDLASALTARAEMRRVAAASALNADRQAKLGQFFTPEEAATLVASLPRLPRRGRLRVLDPGAGTGALTAALTARVMRECPQLQLEIVALEVDVQAATYLNETLADITATATDAGVDITTELLVGDFITLGTDSQSKPALLHAPFDLVIMNPPYQKLGVGSIYRVALQNEGIECPNLYAAFLALASIKLRTGGQLVAITPRSFTNGPYFSQFRRYLLDRVSLNRVHVFESRSTVFADTGVLQENIVFSATFGVTAKDVTISTSRGHTDEITQRAVRYDEVLHDGDNNGFIRIPAGDGDTTVAQTVNEQPADLSDLKVRVSTGKVVDFRVREHLLADPAPGNVPLIYPGNLCGGVVSWPRAIRKNQAFAVHNASDTKYLMPEGYYVVVKRFSAKEERRRVVAAVWDPHLHPGPIAFENHLNVFHAGGVGGVFPFLWTRV